MRGKVKAARIAQIILVAAVMLAMLVRPDRYIESTLNGITVFAVNVLPALFPYFFLSKLLISLGTADALSNCLRKPVGVLYRTSGNAGFILVMSVLCGYPVGARITYDLHSSGDLSSEEAAAASAFASTSGPIFIIGTVAGGMFGNHKLGYVILAAHIAGALLNGLLYRGKRAATAAPRKSCNYTSLMDCIYESVGSVLAVGGYIAIFTTVSQIMLDLNIIGVITGIAALIGGSPLSEYNIEFINSVAVSLIEMTRGLHMLSALTENASLLVPTAAFIISFGGLSVTMQSVTYLGKCSVSSGKYLLRKITQAALSAACAYIICLIFTL